MLNVNFKTLKIEFVKDVFYRSSIINSFLVKKLNHSHAKLPPPPRKLWLP